MNARERLMQNFHEALVFLVVIGSGDEGGNVCDSSSGSVDY